MFGILTVVMDVFKIGYYSSVAECLIPIKIIYPVVQAVFVVVQVGLDLPITQGNNLYGIIVIDGGFGVSPWLLTELHKHIYLWLSEVCFLPSPVLERFIVFGNLKSRRKNSSEYRIRLGPEH